MYGIAEKVAGLTVDDSPDAGRIRTTVFRFTNCALPLVDNAGVGGHLSKKLYTMPKGLNIIQTVVAKLSISKTSAGMSDTFDGDIGLGTTAEDGTATPLASTEQDVLPNTSTPQAVAGVSTVSAQNTAQVIQDGSGGAKALYLNFLVDDADQDATGTPVNAVFDGTIEMQWTIGTVKAPI